VNLLTNPPLIIRKLDYHLLGKVFLLISAAYLCYFWTGLSLFFFPSELSYSDYLFGIGVATIVNIGILLPLIPYSSKIKWVIVPLQILGVIIYLDFLDGNAWLLGVLGIITNIVGINIMIWKTRKRGNI